MSFVSIIFPVLLCGYVLFFCRQHASVVGTLSGHASWVLSVAFSPDGKYFASSSSDKTVKVWELASKQCVHTFSEHNDQVSLWLQSSKPCYCLQMF